MNEKDIVKGEFMDEGSIMKGITTSASGGHYEREYLCMRKAGIHGGTL